MSQELFVNLPVEDLQASMAFFAKLGFQFRSQFTDETAACMVIGENNYVMLLTHAKFQSFLSKRIADSRQTAEVMLGISQESRERVDELVSLAIAHGGKTYAEPVDHGFMYEHGFEDLDGHIWALFYMDPAVLHAEQTV